jgi:hypothetical protein
MTTNHLYHTWQKKIMQLFPDERITRVRNLAWLITGIYLARSVHLSHIASKVTAKAALGSVTRRLDRFLENSAVRVRAWYEPLVKDLLMRRQGQTICLIVDGSKVSFDHQWLVVTLAYRKRALPLVWMWLRAQRGHSSAGRQLALLRYVHGLMPPDTPVLVLGDTEFGSVEVLQQLDEWHWQYALRQKGSHQIRAGEADPWIDLGSLVEKAGESRWMGRQLLTQAHAYGVNVLAHWKLGETEPWLLATNLPSFQAAIAAYEKRMWIEEMFGDFKKHGFDLESTHLREVFKLQRLTFAVVLLYLDLVTAGAKAIKAGLRHWVDRSDRRDLSVFRIGFYLRERLIANSQRFQISFNPVL